MHALEQPVEALIGEAVILNGSGTFNGSGWRGAGSPVRARPRRLARIPIGRLLVAMGQLAPKDEPSNAEERMLLAASLLDWLRGAVARDEAASSKRFDLIAFARPDVLIHTPVRPWCTWDSLRVPLLCLPKLHQTDLFEVHADSL